MDQSKTDSLIFERLIFRFMGYFWLNQRSEESSGYSDVEGEVYHYRSNVPGFKQLSKGDRFVYYRPGEHVLFGTGKIEKIEVRGETEESTKEAVSVVQPNVPASRLITEYLARIEDYRPFEPVVSAREIKEDISFLKGRKGLTGVPQNSIYQIERKDFLTILRSAGLEN